MFERYFWQPFRVEKVVKTKKKLWNKYISISRDITFMHNADEATADNATATVRRGW